MMLLGLAWFMAATMLSLTIYSIPSYTACQSSSDVALSFRVIWQLLQTVTYQSALTQWLSLTSDAQIYVNICYKLQTFDRSNFNHDMLAVKIVGNWFLKLGIVNQFSSACSLICQIILGEPLMPRELAWNVNTIIMQSQNSDEVALHF